MGPSNTELKAVKPWYKINLFSFELISLGNVLQESEADQHSHLTALSTLNLSPLGMLII
jgi:hypothetical protein